MNFAKDKEVSASIACVFFKKSLRQSKKSLSTQLKDKGAKLLARLLLFCASPSKSKSKGFY
jgi:hypothetical protein